MHEPISLVLLELLCWFLVFQVVGAVIALVYDGRIKRARTAAGA
jgi:hypothetical protein